MSLATLRLFGAVKASEQPQNPIILKEYGVLISSHAAYDHRNIIQYLKENAVGIAERNSAFWESWQKVANASDFQLIAEQIIHYISTYGLESVGIDAVQEGLVYIPESAFVDHEPVALKVINAISATELIRRCFHLLDSGMALGETTLADIISVLIECEYQITGDEKIRNKEAQVLFYRLSGKLPQKGDELFRYLIYWFSDQTLVINNEELRDKIKLSHKALPHLESNQEIELAKDFNRHRDLWMAMKGSSRLNRTTVNHISRLSKKYHTPLKQNALNLLTGPVHIKTKELDTAIKQATLGQLVRAYNAISLREQEPQGSVYRIRNGKQWTSTKIPPTQVYTQYKQALLAELRKRIGSTKVYIEPFVDYAFPVSEKSFVGSVPNGTILKFPQRKSILLVGIHWDDPYTDLDFRADSSEFSLGWNTGLRNRSRNLMHSGDMTRAPEPYGATEWIYASEVNSTFNLKVNLYRGEDFSKHFKLMVGISDKLPDSAKQIPPKDIVFSTDVQMPNKQMGVGMLYPEGDNICLMLSVSSTGKHNVGHYSQFDTIQQDVFAKQVLSALRLKDVVTVVERPGEGVVNLSISDVSKDKLLFQ